MSSGWWGVNGLINADEPNIADFFLVMFRSIFFAFFISFLISAAFGYFEMRESIFFKYCVAACFVFFEEQARWIYCTSSNYPLKRAVYFLSYILISEAMLNLTGNFKYFSEIMQARIAPSIVHVVMTIVFLMYVRHQKFAKFYFFLAVAIHTIYNRNANFF
jgi:hypothetical protein